VIDLDLIRKDPEQVRANLARRGDDKVLALLEEVRARDEEWRHVHGEADRLRRRRNDLSRRLAEAKRGAAVEPAEREEAARLPAQLSELEGRERKLEEERRAALLRLPNLMDPSVPFGKDDSENLEVARRGTPAAAGFERLGHAELAEGLGGADFERGRRVSGAGFYFLTGEVAQLDLALQRFALDLLLSRGFELVLPPLALRREAYQGVVDLGDFENVMYPVAGEDLFLIATSEHPLVARFLGEILDEETLPLRFVGLSACFRKEIGGHGVDQKGIFRVHQFTKVEQIVFCAPEDSGRIHEELRANAEEVFRRLEVPYRVVNVCTGDLGTVAAKKYDIEAYFERQGRYREVVSCSNCTDYQARRLGIRMGRAGKPGKGVPHTLNSTAVATSRGLAVILENYQQPDGSLVVPKVLRPYLGGREVLYPRKPRGSSS
jgi:seryl-tRNA synthetase